MPELPEVDCVKQGIIESFCDEKSSPIKSIWTSDSKNLQVLLDPQSLDLKKLVNYSIKEVERKGKYLRIHFSKQGVVQYHLIAHLGMSGVWQASDSQSIAFRQKHTHLELHFSNGTCLRYTDPRKFGYLCLQNIHDPSLRWENLGPDAISAQWTSTALFNSSRNSKIAIKVFLMDQSKVAGIGNIYASEALFASHVHPERPANSISLDECKGIVESTKRIMRASIRNKGTTFSDYRLTNGKGGAFQDFLKVFQKPNQPCPTCHKPIQQITQGGRSTFFCGFCQN